MNSISMNSNSMNGILIDRNFNGQYLDEQYSNGRNSLEPLLIEASITLDNSNKVLN